MPLPTSRRREARSDGGAKRGRIGSARLLRSAATAAVLSSTAAALSLAPPPSVPGMRRPPPPRRRLVGLLSRSGAAAAGGRAVTAAAAASVGPWDVASTGEAEAPAGRAKEVATTTTTAVDGEENAREVADGERGGSKRRPPPSNRMALRWVVEGVEKLIEEEGSLAIEDGAEPLKRRKNKELVDALWDLYFARTQKDVTEAGQTIESLRIEQTETYAVQERVVKAVAMAGLMHISLGLLRTVLHCRGEGESHSRPYVPSSMSYIAVLNGLRRSGKLRQMERVLLDVAGACRLAEQGVAHSEDDDDTAVPPRVDIIAFNTYLAALCDAAVNSYKSVSSKRKSDRTSAPLRDDTLALAVDLLRPGEARNRFAVAEPGPDLISYNTVLAAAARIGNATAAEGIWGLMSDRGMKGDVYTYNARIRAALAGEGTSPAGTAAAGGGGESEVLRLIGEVLSDPELGPDRYTIDLALVPLARDGQIGRILKLLGDFESGYATKDTNTYVSALSSFLSTLVKAGEIEMARTVFDGFVLPLVAGLGAETEGLAHAEMELQRDSATSLPLVDLELLTRHFNVLIEGYRRSTDVRSGGVHRSAHVNEEGQENAVSGASNAELKQGGDAVEHISPYEHAANLFQIMVQHNVPLDAHTMTSMLGIQTTSKGITLLLKRAVSEWDAHLTPIVYHSIMSAYGRADDPSSACLMFDQMGTEFGESRNVKSWNILLGALSAGSRSNSTLDVRSSTAAAALGSRSSAETSEDFYQSGISGMIEGETCASAARILLDLMSRPGKGARRSSALRPPRPNSQTYCLVAAAMANDIAEAGGGGAAMDLFREATRVGVPADGRFLNACIRCFGDNLDEALLAWKTEMRPAALAHENRKRHDSSLHYRRKGGKNLLAAYHGLLHVCGTAGRPDIAVRLAYAMNKEGLEPNETSLNCYNAGKRIRERDIANGVAKGGIRMTDQYESLLAIECTKYDQNDKRRSKEKRVRIIF